MPLKLFLVEFWTILEALSITSFFLCCNFEFVQLHI